MKPKIPMIVSSPDASLNSPTNSSQSDTLQVKLTILVKHPQIVVYIGFS